MAGKFKFKLFTTADPQAQYNAVAEKDPLTFYLLSTGVGYLGSVKLFDATDDGITLVQTIADDNASTTDAASVKAITEYVAAKISAINVLTTKFFRDVKSHTLTDADMTNENISKPVDAKVGDIGILFTADTNDTDDSNESWYFISLMNYLNTVYSFVNGKTITFTVGEDNSVSAEVKIASDETALKAGDNGLYIDKSTTVDAKNPSNRLITESAVVNFVKEALADSVTFIVDNGSNG